MSSLEESSISSDVSSSSGTQPEREPAVTAINHYVIKSDIRACMSEETQALYCRVIDGIFARETRIPLSGDYDAALLIRYALKLSPYFFLLDSCDMTKDHRSLSVSYAYSQQEQADMVSYIDEEYLRMLNEAVTPDMSEMEKVLAVYHEFAQRIQYDYVWANENQGNWSLIPDIGIYQALKSGYGACHTYTYLCQFALQQLGIECLPVSGKMADDPTQSHMWLLVRIDGKYYHCDPTWDSRGKSVSLTYFGMTDQERIESGVKGFENSYDKRYGEVLCDNKRFARLRNVWDYKLIGHNRIQVVWQWTGRIEEMALSTLLGE